MKALGYYLVVTELPEETKKTSYGLELGEAHREDIRYRRATVNFVGDTVQGIEQDDLILFDKHAGHDCDIGDETFKVITIRDVIGVL